MQSKLKPKKKKKKSRFTVFLEGIGECGGGSEEK